MASGSLSADGQAEMTATVAAIESLRLAEYPNLVWFIVEDCDGVQGIGETYLGAQAVESYLHETAAPLILGSPIDPEPLRLELRACVGYQAPGAERRGASAIDLIE